MKTKFIYVIMAVLLMGSQMTLSAQNTDNKQKKQRPTPEQMVQMQTKQIVNLSCDEIEQCDKMKLEM